jgi:hypothetical protein
MFLHQHSDENPSISAFRDCLGETRKPTPASAPYQPPPGCRIVNYNDDELAGKLVRIFAPETGKYLVLYGGPYLQKRPPIITDIQLNTAQIRHLFGGDLTEETRPAFAITEPVEALTDDPGDQSCGKTYSAAMNIPGNWHQRRG